MVSDYMLSLLNFGDYDMTDMTRMTFMTSIF